jgi:integrase
MIDSSTARPLAAAVAADLMEFVEDFLGHYSPPFKSASTQRALRTVLGRVMRIPGVETTADLTEATVAECVRGMMVRGLSRATIQTALVGLRVACDYAIRRGQLRSNPVEARKHWLPNGYAGTPLSRPVHLVDDQVTRLMIHLMDLSVTSWEGHRLYALAAIIVYGGLRKSEALELGMTDVDLASGRLRFGTGPSARRSRRMPAKLIEILGAWLPRTGCRWAFPGTLLKGPWTGGSPGSKAIDALKAAGRSVGIEGLTFDLLREFWHWKAGQVTLGPAFHELPDPSRSYVGPAPGRPGPTAHVRADAAASRPSVVLELPDREVPPIVRGRRLGERLTATQFNILTAMLRAACLKGERLTEAQLALRSGHNNPVRTLRDLRKIPPWDTVLVFPGKRGRGGYGLAPR